MVGYGGEVSVTQPNGGSLEREWRVKEWRDGLGYLIDIRGGVFTDL